MKKLYIFIVIYAIVALFVFGTKTNKIKEKMTTLETISEELISLEAAQKAAQTASQKAAQTAAQKAAQTASQKAAQEQIINQTIKTYLILLKKALELTEELVKQTNKKEFEIKTAQDVTFYIKKINTAQDIILNIQRIVMIIINANYFNNSKVQENFKKVVDQTQVVAPTTNAITKTKEDIAQALLASPYKPLNIPTQAITDALAQITKALTKLGITE